MSEQRVKHQNNIREHIYSVIFEADTPAGRTFDITLFGAIILSVIIVMLETTKPFSVRYHNLLYTLEWILTIFFTIEYVLRLYSVYKPMKYATSFFGIVDLLAIIPTYLSVFIVGSQSLIVIRVLRLLRIFRIFKLANHMKQGRMIVLALRRSGPKILVFIVFILLLVIIIGSIMYLVEGNSNPQFDSIPRSIYWAIVTLTTVGYGDISPTTNLGQFMAAMVMILGYSVIAVPTGIVTVEMTRAVRPNVSHNACHNCGGEDHDPLAHFCKHCGHPLGT